MVCEAGRVLRRSMDLSIDGAPMNLAGYSAKLQVRSARNSDEVLLEAVTPADMQLSGSILTMAVLVPLPVGTYTYGLDLFDPSDEQVDFLEGPFVVRWSAVR